MSALLIILYLLIATGIVIIIQYMSLFLYVHKGCKDQNKTTRKTMKQFLKMISKTKKLYETEYKAIIIPFNFGDTPGLINMATSVPKAPVVFKPVWGYHFARNSDIFGIAFMHSVGHELGHWSDIKRGPGFSDRPKEEKEFFLWVREIRNDFEGINILERHVPNVTRDQIINAIDCKANAPVIEFKPIKKKKQNRRGNSYRDHPEWGLRLQMLKCGQFSKEIIRKIADEAECKNAEYIREVVKMYFPE